MYEEQILATGSLDERIFTGEGANEEIGTPGPCLCEGLENQNSATSRLHTSLAVRLRAHVFRFTLSSHLSGISSLCSRQASALKVSTPLTGRKYIQENVVASPISTAMNSVGRLHTLLSGTQQGPSAKLAETLRCVLNVNLSSEGWGPVVLRVYRSRKTFKGAVSLTGSNCFYAERVPEIPVMSSLAACGACSSSSRSISRAAVQRTGGWAKAGARASATLAVLASECPSDAHLCSAEMAVKYFHLAEALYYRILESVIEREKMILGNTDLSVSVKEG